MMIIQHVQLVIYLLLSSFLFLDLINSVRENCSTQLNVGFAPCSYFATPHHSTCRTQSPVGGLRIGGPSLSPSAHIHEFHLSSRFALSSSFNTCGLLSNNQLTSSAPQIPYLHTEARTFRTRESSRDEQSWVFALPIILGSP